MPTRSHRGAEAKEAASKIKGKSEQSLTRPMITGEVARAATEEVIAEAPKESPTKAQVKEGTTRSMRARGNGSTETRKDPSMSTRPSPSTRSSRLCPLLAK